MSYRGFLPQSNLGIVFGNNRGSYNFCMQVCCQKFCKIVQSLLKIFSAPLLYAFHGDKCIRRCVQMLELARWSANADAGQHA